MEIRESETFIFNIISNVGMARSCYIEAIKMAKSGDFDLATKRMSEGDSYYHEGHQSHMNLIQLEAEGNGLTPSLILIHAEDLLMSSEAFQIIATEMIDLHKRVSSNGTDCNCRVL